MKVLLLHGSLGAGHQRAAQALQENLQERKIPCEVQDLLDFLPGPMGNFYSRSYNYLIHDCRWLWRSLYESTNRPKSAYTPGRTWWQKWQFDRLRNYLEGNEFTHVISTYFATSALLSDWAVDYNLRGKFYSVITDYEAHRYWKKRGLQKYFVPCQEVAEQLQAAGIPAEKTMVTGIPVGRAFAGGLSREDARANWSCAPDEMVLLVLCSALNLRRSTNLLQDIAKLKDKIRVLVSTGSDPEKEAKIKTAFQNDQRFTIFGFSRRIGEMMCAADLMLSKPGGLIVSEALASGLPQILFSPIPGQEEANAEYASRHGAAICVQEEPGTFQKLVGELLRDRHRLSKMAEDARAIGKPHAARDIVDSALAD